MSNNFTFETYEKNWEEILIKIKTFFKDVILEIE